MESVRMELVFGINKEELNSVDYFWIYQNRKISDTPHISNFSKDFKRRDFSYGNQYKIPDLNVVFTKSEKPLHYVNILDKQLFLISEAVKKVFDMYDRTIQYKAFCTLNNRLGQYNYYYAPIFKKIDCLLPSSYSSLNNHSLEQVIINESKINGFCICNVSDSDKEVVIVSLDVIESILRRGLYDFSYEKVHIG